MVTTHYGDIIVVGFDPSLGLEIKKRRPAIVVSNDQFNETSKMRLICPITHTDRLYSIPIPQGLAADGFVLVQQIKSLDLSARDVQIVGQMDKNTMLSVSNLLKLIL